MTDYFDVPIVYTGDWIDSAWINQFIGDNLRAFKQGFVNAGDMAYAQDGNTIGAVAKPSVDSLLKNTTAGVPSWLAIANLPGRLHTYGTHYSDSGLSTTSTSFVNTGITFNLTLGVVCHVFAFAFGTGMKASGAYNGEFIVSINGSNDPNEAIVVKSTSPTPFGTMYYVENVPTGSRVVHLRYRTENASDALTCYRAGLYALAFVA